MKHITKVRELYEETIHWISESEDSWKNFLSCMGRLYQLDFLNTCMVYAQRPDASVLAGYDAWLEMDLPVARGSKGIAVFPSKIFGDLNEKLNSGFGPNARVNSIQVEVTFAHIFAILSLIIITPYNVLAADCLPVQIGDNYEK